MSRQAIAAVLARDDLTGGGRLVALSLASFVDRENRAWPGAPAAAARAGVGRSRYQEAREQLVRRGLVNVDGRATGRGRAATVTLAFAETGPWWDGDVTAELVEAVLGYQLAVPTPAFPLPQASRPGRQRPRFVRKPGISSATAFAFWSSEAGRLRWPEPEAMPGPLLAHHRRRPSRRRLRLVD